MFLKDYQEEIAKVQLENYDVDKYPPLLSLCKPGETGFKLREDSKQILINILEVKPRESKSKIIISADIKNKMKGQGEKVLEDAQGVFPFLCVVMESSSPSFKVGDIAYYNPEEVAGRGTVTVVIKQALAMIVNEYALLGTIDKI